jgi:hypothetical protein
LYWNEITPEMLASCTPPGTSSEIARVANLATEKMPSKASPKQEEPSHIAPSKTISHSVNAPENSQFRSQSGLATSQPEPSPQPSGTTGQIRKSGDANSEQEFDALFLKKPVKRVLERARERGWKFFHPTPYELISALTNLADIYNKGRGRLPTRLEVARDLLYAGKGGLVSWSFLNRLVKQWVKYGYVFEKGRQLIANRDFFPWGTYAPKAPMKIDHVKADEHHHEFWLVPEGYWRAYAAYYDACGTRIGAPNVGEKRIAIDKLKLYGINVLGLKDYAVYAYPNRGIKCNCYVNGYTTLEELERRRADCKQVVQAIVQGHAREAFQLDIKFSPQDGPGNPHTTIPGSGALDVIMPSPAGRSIVLPAEGPNGSHPGQAETDDPNAPGAVNLTNKLIDAQKSTSRDVERLRQDFNQVVDVISQLPAVIKQLAENQVLAVNASNESSKALNAGLEGVKDTVAQLANQVGSLVQTLMQQQGLV